MIVISEEQGKQKQAATGIRRQECFGREEGKTVEDSQEEDRGVTRGMPIWQKGSTERFVRKRTTVKTDNNKRLQVRELETDQWMDKQAGPSS